MYKHKEVEARVAELSPALRRLVEENLRRGELFAKSNMPAVETYDSEMEAQLRSVLSDPALKQEWDEFWRSHKAALLEDAAAIARGEHDHEL